MATTMLNRKRTLVINRNYQPVTTVSLRRAITMLCKEIAVIVLPPDGENKVWQELTWADWSLLKPKEGEDVLRATTAIFKIPEIIRLENYSKVPYRQVKLSRRAIYNRDQNTCQYCGMKLDPSDWSIDHIVPKCEGGKTEWTNCVLSCTKCNRKKGCRSLKASGLKLLKKPVMPEYDILQGRTIRIDSWTHFLGDCFWEVPLKN